MYFGHAYRGEHVWGVYRVGVVWTLATTSFTVEVDFYCVYLDDDTLSGVREPALRLVDE
jgi:hypothetical protein